MEAEEEKGNSDNGTDGMSENVKQSSPYLSNGNVKDQQRRKTMVPELWWRCLIQCDKSWVDRSQGTAKQVTEGDLSIGIGRCRWDGVTGE